MPEVFKTEVLVMPDGQVRFLWDDTLQPLLDLGPSRVKRASVLEPSDPDDGRRGWFAWPWLLADQIDDVPILGPFPTRGAALEAERAWVAEHLAELEV